MALRSIYEIEVEDSKFKEFLDAFTQHQQDVGDLGTKWQAAMRPVERQARGISDYTKQFASEFANISQRGMAAAKAEGAAMLSVATHVKAAAGWQDRFTSGLAAGAKHLHGMKADVADVTSHIAEGTRWLLKWASISTALGGLVGAGGLFGLDRLAEGVAGRRYAAQGLGVTASEQQAFGLGFSRFFDTNAVLGNVAGAQQDWARRWAFSGLGMDQRQVSGMRPDQLAIEMAPRAKRLWDSGDQSQQFAQAHGLLEFYTMEDLRRLHAMSEQDLETARSRYEQYEAALRLPDSLQSKWVDFQQQLATAGAEIDKTFIEGLTPLTGPLGDLSKAVVGAIATFMKSDELKVWIKDFGGGIKWVADYLSSGEFRRDIVDFVHEIGDMARSLKAALQWLGIIPSASTPAMVGSAFGNIAGGFGAETRGTTPGTHATVHGNLGMFPSADPFTWFHGWGGHFYSGGTADTGGDWKTIAAGLGGAGLNTTGQAGALAAMNAESGLIPSKVYSGGDTGIAQWTAGRKRALYAWAAAHNLSPLSMEAQVGYLRQELTTNPQFRAMVQRMNAAITPRAAAKIFGYEFEQGRADPSKFGGGNYDQAYLDAFHSRGAEGFYNKLKSDTAAAIAASQPKPLPPNPSPDGGYFRSNVAGDFAGSVAGAGRVAIEIKNNTGGSAIISASQVGAP